MNAHHRPTNQPSDQATKHTVVISYTINRQKQLNERPNDRTHAQTASHSPPHARHATPASTQSSCTTHASIQPTHARTHAHVRACTVHQPNTQPSHRTRTNEHNESPVALRRTLQEEVVGNSGGIPVRTCARKKKNVVHEYAQGRGPGLQATSRRGFRWACRRWSPTESPPASCAASSWKSRSRRWSASTPL